MIQNLVNCILNYKIKCDLGNIDADADKSVQHKLMTKLLESETIYFEQVSQTLQRNLIAVIFTPIMAHDLVFNLNISNTGELSISKGTFCQRCKTW